MLRACLSEELRVQAWRFACTIDLYETELGVQVGTAMAAAFASEPPEGRSSAWLHTLEPESVRQVLSDLTMDFRSENLSEERLVDALQKLKDKKDARTREAMRRAGASPQELFDLLKARKSALRE